MGMSYADLAHFDPLRRGVGGSRFERDSQRTGSASQPGTRLQKRAPSDNRLHVNLWRKCEA